MKAPLIAALLLSGCAAQPYQAPTVYSPPIDHETECLKAVIAINVFSDMATPMLKVVAPSLTPDGYNHPQVVAFRAKTPAMNAQLERFTKRIGQ